MQSTCLHAKQFTCSTEDSTTLCSKHILKGKKKINKSQLMLIL